MAWIGRKFYSKRHKNKTKNCMDQKKIDLTLRPINQSEAVKSAIRDGFGRGLLELGKTHPNVVVLSSDVSESVRALEFAKAYPDRFIEVGVAEQNMIGIASGLAFEGLIPFCAAFAVFSPGRNWDQIRISVCYQNSNVKIVGSHAGISVGPDGATHQAMEDIALTRVLPNMTVIAPADALEAKKAAVLAASINGPVYLRLARDKQFVITSEETPFEYGKAFIFREGTDCTIAAIGAQVQYALEAAAKLSEKGVECEVINLAFIKPIDEKTVIKSVKKTGCLVSAEEHQAAGGLGSALSEVLARNHPVPQEFVCMPDSFGESGESVELLAKWGMDANAIVSAVKKAVKRK
jgi:transketolase